MTRLDSSVLTTIRPDAPPVAERPWRLALWAATAAFATYFCMYAYRKPFTAATFEGLYWWGVQYKIVLVVAQVLGYMSSKFIGIKVISDMAPGRHIAALLGLAELSLVGFGLTPFPYNFIWMLSTACLWAWCSASCFRFWKGAGGDRRRGIFRTPLF